MFLTTDEAANAIGARTAMPETPLGGVSTDSRTIKVGYLFVALRGERFDGHDYVAEAFSRGASAAVVDTAPASCEGKCLVTPDTLMAYGQLASVWRRNFDIPIIAVTGSVGKTTMKEMVALALSPLGPVLKSDKNENNEVGVPQTLLRLSADHRAAVVEMGMRGFGQIDYLTKIAQPVIGVVTKIGESHLELVGSRKGIADAKGELLELLPDTGVAVLNIDDPYFDYLSKKTRAKIVTFGVSAGADILMAAAGQVGSSRSVRVRSQQEAVEFTLNSPAFHDVSNAAGALAVAVSAGVSLLDAASALEEYHSSNMRMNARTAIGGAVILDDCYNAAPTSVVSALRTLRDYPRTGKKIAFLGDMRELGMHAKQLHADVAAAAADNSIGEVYAVGELMPQAFPDACSFKNALEAAEYVRSQMHLSPDDTVLVKGSRALELETVVMALVEL